MDVSWGAFHEGRFQKGTFCEASLVEGLFCSGTLNQGMFCYVREHFVLYVHCKKRNEL